MAKKKKKKTGDKKKFEHWNELIGLILVIVSVLSIVPSPLGFIGEIGASFAMFLIGTWYQVFLLYTFIIGCYLIYKRKAPNFFTSRLIGLYSLLIGLLVLGHINYVKVNSNDVLIVFKDTIQNLLDNFSAIINGSVLTLKGAGVIGATLSIVFYKLFDIVGTYIVSTILITLSIILLTGVDLIEIIKKPFKMTLLF